MNKKMMISMIQKALNQKDLTLLKDILIKEDTFMIQDIFEAFETKDQFVLFRLLSKTQALEIFTRIDAVAQSELLQQFQDEEAFEIFKSLEVDEKVEILDELPATVAKRLIESLSKKENEQLSLLMGYPAGTVGRMMSPHFVRLTPDMSVEKALNHAKSKVKTSQSMHQLFITSAERVLLGFIDLSELILEDGTTLLKDVMQPSDYYAYATDTEQIAASRLQDSDRSALPILDSEDRLIGILTFDDAMDVLEEDSIEKALSKAGFSDSYQETSRSKILTQGSLLQVWRVRLPYLMIALAGGLIAGLAIEQFEASLEAVAALAFFIPVIMDMGGNVGTQSSTIFTRALIFGHVSTRRFKQQWIREILIGLTMGIVSALVAGGVIFLWQGDIRLVITVSLSLIFTITIASAVGFLVPALLSRLGFDQAAGSDPFITTIKDVTGLLIYFTLASLIMAI